MATTGQLAEFPYNEDTSGGDHSLLGIGFVQSSIGGGVRSSSSTSYLANANKRPNLTVLINVTVEKLLKTGMRANLKSFRSVQFRASPGTKFINSRILNDNVLRWIHPNNCDGSQRSYPFCWHDWNSANTPIVWLGNPHDLVSLGIPVVIDNPAVGANLIDHVILPNIFNVKGEESLDTLRDPNLLGAAIDEWTTNKTGIIANSVANTFGFARLPTNSPIVETLGDPASGPKSPHWKLSSQ